MKIRTTYERNAPDPWMAVDDDTYDGPPAPVGTGATEDEAIAELMEKLYEKLAQPR